MRRSGACATVHSLLGRTGAFIVPLHERSEGWGRQKGVCDRIVSRKRGEHTEPAEPRPWLLALERANHGRRRSRMAVLPTGTGYFPLRLCREVPVTPPQCRAGLGGPEAS